MRVGRLRTLALGLSYRACAGRLLTASFSGAADIPTTRWVRPSPAATESSLRSEDEEHGEGEEKEEVKKSLTVAIMGPPNAGKSVLLNALVKDHVSAVSRKRNTTSSCILGATTIGNTQLVFTDTPGTIVDRKESKRVPKDIIKAYRDAMFFATDVLLVADAAKRWDDNYRACLRHVVREGVENECHVTVVLNKVDLVNPKAKLLDLASEVVAIMQEEQVKAVQAAADDKELRKRLIASQRGPPSPVFMVSARDEDGVSDVLQHMLERATEGDWYLEDGEITDMKPQERVRELLKELIFNEFHQEIPYGIDQETRSWERSPDGSRVTIYHDLLVPTESYGRILRGRGGARLSLIRERAIPRLQQILKVPTVNLRLWVRVTTSNQSKVKRLRERGG